MQYVLYPSESDVRILPLKETQTRHGYTQPHHPQQLRCTVRYSNIGRGTETDGTELCNLLFWDAIQPTVRLSQVPSKLAAVQPFEQYYENFGASKHGTFHKEELQPTFLNSFYITELKQIFCWRTQHQTDENNEQSRQLCRRALW